MLTRYGRRGASSRLRTLQHLPWFEEAGWDARVAPLIDDTMLARKYRSGGYGRAALADAYARRVHALLGRRDFDLVWIEKEALPWWPAEVELSLLRGVPYVLDYDDALFHAYDLHRSALVRRVLGTRLDRLMGGARLVVAGNRYLADRATAAGAAWVEVVPTVLDARRYPATPEAPLDAPRVVWIGSPSTARYLRNVAEPLRELALTTPFVLRVIGGGDLELPGVPTEHLAWTEATEARHVSEGAIGIMPLDDTPWERGKCAYKLLQYMACGLPAVASPVGANLEVVRHGENGFLAADDAAWVAALRTLLTEPATRARMGATARAQVEARYDLRATAPQLVALANTAAARRRR